MDTKELNDAKGKLQSDWMKTFADNVVELSKGCNESDKKAFIMFAIANNGDKKETENIISEPKAIVGGITGFHEDVFELFCKLFEQDKKIKRVVEAALIFTETVENKMMGETLELLKILRTKLN